MITALSFKVYSALRYVEQCRWEINIIIYVCAGFTALYSHHKYTNAYKNTKTKQKIGKITKIMIIIIITIIVMVIVRLLEYKRNWIQHVNRMPRDSLPRIMKHYSPTGRRNRGRPLKRLLDTWDRNGSTSDLTPLQIYDDDDDLTFSLVGGPWRKATYWKTKS